MTSIYQTVRPIVSQAETLYNRFSSVQLQDKNTEHRLSVGEEHEGKPGIPYTVSGCWTCPGMRW